jgi:hypothetical protein
MEALRAFRQQVYTLFGCRRDALFETLDAVLSAPSLETPAHLSLAPSCQRGWGSLYDALNAGTMDLAQLERLVAAYPLAPQTSWFAVDASVWPRCDAETSPQRGYYPHPYRHSHGQPIVAGWNYSWLVQVPRRCSSWTAPLRVRRIIPGENVNQVAAEQIRSWLEQGDPPVRGVSVPIFTFDAGYDAVQLSLALADLPVGLLVRLRAGRCFYADPTAQLPTGRPRRHGRKFVCDAPATWPIPSATWTVVDPDYGQICRRPGRGCTPPRKTMRRGGRADHGPSCGERSSDSTSNSCRVPRKLRSPSGFGGRDPRPRTCPSSGGPTLRGSPWNTPFASSSKPCAGRRPNSAPRARLTGGRGSCSWPIYTCASHATRSPMCAYPGRHPWRRSDAPLLGSVAPFRTCSYSWAALSACQNPVAARQAAPEECARRLLYASRPSN